MSDDASAGFGKFVPGFDFLQSLAKGAAQSVSQVPGLGGWVAPTLSLEELDKRIQELKAVQYWLDQNATALKATVQALEVQRMTLATLKGMNVSMGEVAKAFAAAPAPAAAPATSRPKPAQSRPAPAPEAAAEAAGPTEPAAAAAAGAGAGAGMMDAMQWWGALTQQFQQIAASAMQEATARARPDGAPAPAAPSSAETPKAAKAAKAAPRKAAAAPRAAARKRAG